jgi:DNA polymerase-3 subunit beta
MNFKCQQSDLSSSLALAFRAIPGKATLPILSNIKIEAGGDGITLTGFNLGLAIETTCPATDISGQSICIPAKLLIDIVSKLSPGEIFVSTAGYTVTIRSTTGEYKISGLPSTEYPELPSAPANAEPYHIPADALINGLHGVLIACSDDETKQILTGVNIKAAFDRLEFAATDGHRLSVVEAAVEGEPSEPINLTVPAKSLKELERMLTTRPAENIALYFSAGQATFEWTSEQGLQRLTTRTIDGKYPDYRMLIPQRFDKQVTIDRKQLISSLERIAVLAEQKNNLVKFDISQVGRLVASVEAQDVGSGIETLPATVLGDGLVTAFNVRYLLDGLRIMATGEVMIDLNGALEQVIFRPVGGVWMIYLVMPVQLHGGNDD